MMPFALTLCCLVLCSGLLLAAPRAARAEDRKELAADPEYKTTDEKWIGEQAFLVRSGGFVALTARKDARLLKVMQMADGPRDRPGRRGAAEGGHEGGRGLLSPTGRTDALRARENLRSRGAEMPYEMSVPGPGIEPGTRGFSVLETRWPRPRNPKGIR
jgi:hypothetical protein